MSFPAKVDEVGNENEERWKEGWKEESGEVEETVQEELTEEEEELKGVVNSNLAAISWTPFQR
jgi:hypothetical protein